VRGKKRPQTSNKGSCMVGGAAGLGEGGHTSRLLLLAPHIHSHAQNKARACNARFFVEPGRQRVTCPGAVPPPTGYASLCAFLHQPYVVSRSLNSRSRDTPLNLDHENHSLVLPSALPCAPPCSTCLHPHLPVMTSHAPTHPRILIYPCYQPPTAHALTHPPSPSPVTKHRSADAMHDHALHFRWSCNDHALHFQ